MQQIGASVQRRSVLEASVPSRSSLPEEAGNPNQWTWLGSAFYLETQNDHPLVRGFFNGEPSFPTDSSVSSSEETEAAEHLKFLARACSVTTGILLAAGCAAPIANAIVARHFPKDCTLVEHNFGTFETCSPSDEFIATQNQEATLLAFMTIATGSLAGASANVLLNQTTPTRPSWRFGLLCFISNIVGMSTSLSLFCATKNKDQYSGLDTVLLWLACSLLHIIPSIFSAVIAEELLNTTNTLRNNLAIRLPRNSVDFPGNLEDLENSVVQENDTELDENASLAECSTKPYFCCPITLATLHNPVLASDGHTYEKQSLIAAFLINPFSPMTNQALVGFCRNPALEEALKQHRSDQHLALYPGNYPSWAQSDVCQRDLEIPYTHIITGKNIDQSQLDSETSASYIRNYALQSIIENLIYQPEDQPMPSIQERIQVYQFSTISPASNEELSDKAQDRSANTATNIKGSDHESGLQADRQDRAASNDQ